MARPWVTYDAWQGSEARRLSTRLLGCRQMDVSRLVTVMKLGASTEWHGGDGAERPQRTESTSRETTAQLMRAGEDVDRLGGRS